MSDYLECGECGANKFMAEWDRVECENGHGVTGNILPPSRRASPASPAIVEAERRVIEAAERYCGSHSIDDTIKLQQALAALRSKQDAPAKRGGLTIPNADYTPVNEPAAQPSAEEEP